jgi:hypothetical protein
MYISDVVMEEENAISPDNPHTESQVQQNILPGGLGRDSLPSNMNATNVETPLSLEPKIKVSQKYVPSPTPSPSIQLAKYNAIQSVSSLISPNNTLAATTLNRLSKSENTYDTNNKNNANKYTFPLDLSNTFQYYTPNRLLSRNNNSPLDSSKTFWTIPERGHNAQIRRSISDSVGIGDRYAEILSAGPRRETSVPATGTIPERGISEAESVGIGRFSGETTHEFRSENTCAREQGAAHLLRSENTSPNAFTRRCSTLIPIEEPPQYQPNLECIDIELALGKSYVDSRNNNTSSNALDVLALYIKGQKLLYTEAKTYCEQQLNFLMLPAIFISCVGSIFSFLSSDYTYGPVIIASLNGFNAFILALISYLKLDAKAQAHKTSAYKFDKLESVCEFNSGKFMFFAADPEEIVSVVERVEKDVKDIKEMNQFILPESIRYEFHFTYSTNVFMLVKRMQLLESSETHNLKNCVNHLTALKLQLGRALYSKNEGVDDSTEKRRMSFVDRMGPALNADNSEITKTLIESINVEEIRKIQFLENVLNCRKKYYELDENFNKEIRDHMKRVNQWFITRVICCDWLKS